MKIKFISPAIKYFKQAEENFEKGEYENALSSLKWGFKKDNGYKPLYKLAIRILDRLEAPEEKNLFENALSNFRQFQPFYNLGYHFIDTGNYDLAQPFFEKALKIDPTSADAAYELSLAYTNSILKNGNSNSIIIQNTGLYPV